MATLFLARLMNIRVKKCNNVNGNAEKNARCLFEKINHEHALFKQLEKKSD